MKRSIIRGMLIYSLLGVLFVYIVLIMQICSYLRELYPMNVFSVSSGDIIWIMIVAIFSYAGMKLAHGIYKNIIPQLLPDDPNPKKSKEIDGSERKFVINHKSRVLTKKSTM